MLDIDLAVESIRNPALFPLISKPDPALNRAPRLDLRWVSHDPHLLLELAEECRGRSEHSQLLVTSHSPFLLNTMRPEEVHVLYREEQGFTQAVRACDITGVTELIHAAAALGHLWMEGHFDVGDPLVNQGAPRTITRKRG